MFLGIFQPVGAMGRMFPGIFNQAGAWFCNMYYS